MVGVSRTADPTADWNLYRIKADPEGKKWLDYPSAGFNKKWIVVQGNMFDLGNGPGFRSHVYVFDKADLYAGGTGKFKLLTSDQLGLTGVPVVDCDNSESMFLVENTAQNSNGKLKLFKISGDVGDPKLSFLGPEIVLPPNAWNFSPPNGVDFAPQKGAPTKIQTDDARIQSVVCRNGLLWCVQTVFLPSGPASVRCAIQWCQLDPNAADAGQRLKQAGRIDDPTGNTFRAFPSIAVNKNEDVLIGYSHFSADEFASCAYSLRRKTDPPNQFRGEVIFRKGKATYFKTFGGSENRWGDYSSTLVDPANDLDFWTIQVFADQPADHYGTQWALVKPPNP